MIRKIQPALILAAIACFAQQPQSIPRRDVKILGPIDYGQPSPTARLAVHPPYSAYSFNAKPGDHIEVTIQGKGDFRAWLTNAEFKKLAGGSAKFTYTFDPASEPATFYILVSEAHHQPSQFTVDLERPSTAAAAPEYLSCSTDSDCVAVDRAGCCHNGYKDAVNASQIAAYRNANACKQRHHMCPMFMILDKRVARCDTVAKRCTMVNPEEARP